MHGSFSAPVAGKFARVVSLFHRRLLWFICSAVLCCADQQSGQNPVFFGPAAQYELVPLIDAQATNPESIDVLRWVWIEERMNVARRNAPVRVPVFLAAGECANPEELILIRWPSREVVATQADDVRRGADGGVARLHLWFTADLNAGDHQRLALIRRKEEGAPSPKAVDARAVGDKLQVSAAGSTVVFRVSAGTPGPLSSLRLSEGPALDFPEGARATVTWSGTVAASETPKEKEKELLWGSGPVFAKVSTQFHDDAGGLVTQVFRIFSDGSLNLVQTVNPAESVNGQTLTSQDFLRGKMVASDQIEVRPQSAGIIDSLIDVHPGYVVDGILQTGRPRGWLVVPGSLGGAAGLVTVDKDKELRVQAPGGLARGPTDPRVGAVRAFWAEVTFVPSRRDGDRLDRAVELAAGQPLVAVVERPGVSLAMATGRLQDNVREIKPVGWVNESVIRFLQGKAEPFPKRKWSGETDPEFWVAGAKKAAFKVTGDSPRALQEDEKGRAAGSLDPYHITYDATALAYWLSRDDLPAPVRDSLRAKMEAVRRQLGRTNEEGWPYLDVFFRTQNMQMGPPLLTLSDSGADPALKQYYRDQLSAPTLGGVMLRGLRPYQGRTQSKPSESDTLYQGVVDFMLRATELTTNESLGLHPVAFGRFLDAIDVNADLYHPFVSRTDDSEGRFARANFFRTQSHLHRWLAWGPAPFIALLKSPPKDASIVPGATEAWQFANLMIGQWKNWPDQSWLFLASVLPEKARVYAPPERPAVVKIVRIQHQTDGNHLAWDKNENATAYRIYRLRRGSPPVWLDSPYRANGQINRLTEWHDTDGKAGDAYVVHAVDQAGRESPW